jgi:alkanesulfonate monooxygenase SsuD/methylene tetrahydromethanopterin reductase-like flavin-dependent oxidoreductase (luciferase family)
MGGIRRTGSEMIAFTEEALQFMRTALDGGVVKFRSGEHTIEGHEAGPVSASPLPLWLGSNGPRMLAVTGRSSDGWVSPLSTYVGPTAVPSRQRVIDDAARSAGRDPADVRTIYNVVGAIGPARRGPGLAGDVESWVAALTDWSVRPDAQRHFVVRARMHAPRPAAGPKGK